MVQIVSSIVAKIIILVTSFIAFSGYFGVFVLMTLESTMIPLPSELVMPFAGYLAFQGEFNFFLVCIVSALGTVAGSLLSYYIGQYGGEPFLERYGKYFFINKSDLKKTHDWFSKKGDKTIFISRFIPVVRHLISLPAGIAKMDKKKFIIYTFLGGLIWNSFLAYLGYLLGKNWEIVHKYTNPLSYFMVGVLLAAAVYFVYKHIYTEKKENNNEYILFCF